MKNDPRTSKKAPCAQCRGPRNDITIAQQDPFCSVKCANEFHDFMPATTQAVQHDHTALSRRSYLKP